MKAYKIKFSGSYKANNDDIYNYNDITVYVPYMDYDLALFHARGRLLPIALNSLNRKEGQQVTLNNIKKIRDSYDDEVEETEHTFSFEGKDIRKLNFEEIQEVATKYDLRAVPLYKSGSLRSQLNALYGEYSNKIRHEPLNYKEEGFNIMDYPPIIAADEYSIKREIKTPQLEQDRDKPREKLVTHSLDELKAIADAKGIKYHHRTGYDSLYSKIYDVDNIV